MDLSGAKIAADVARHSNVVIAVNANQRKMH
jgi:hypothetical protein